MIPTFGLVGDADRDEVIDAVDEIVELLPRRVPRLSLAKATPRPQSPGSSDRRRRNPVRRQPVRGRRT